MDRGNKGISRSAGLAAAAALTLTTLCLGAWGAAAWAAPAPVYTGTARGPVKFKVTAALRTLAPEVVVEAQGLPDDVQFSPEGPYREQQSNFPLPKAVAAAEAAAAAAAIENPAGVAGPAPAAPVPYKVVTDEVPMGAPSTRMEGLAQTNNRQLMGYGIYPPDTVGAASDAFYVQMVNSAIAVWDLRLLNDAGTGPRMVVSPRKTNVLWKGMGTMCDTHNDGDPIVNYDEAAGRWIVSQFAIPTASQPTPVEYHQCVAISKTADPTGSWYAYDYLVSTTKMNDYPKFGIWPDGYYLSVNQFDGGGWAGVGALVFERAKMLAGSAGARMIYVDTGAYCSNFTTGTEPACQLGGMLPSDAEGVPPIPGSPNFFVQFDDDTWLYSGDQLQIWEMRTNWAAGTASFSRAAQLAVNAFDSQVCAGYARSCIPQPGTAVGLDAISDRLMYRAQFRNRGFYNSMVLNHTVKDGTRAAIRWYELRQGPTGIWSVLQQGTHAPADTRSRWMGSVAMDRDGNIALGYSLSGADIYPTIAYAGRLASDGSGTLPQTEVIATSSAGGAQTGPQNRWGDYSAMDVAPDGCTFWYTNEYLRGTTAAEWSTWIGAFRFPSCTPGTLRQATFKSTGSLDGWVLETGETTNVGGTKATGGPLKLGDDALNRQYKSILSFPTAALPDSAVVVGALVQVRKKGLVGGDPLSTIASFGYVDIGAPYFGPTSRLESVDFSAAPTMVNIAQFLNYHYLNSWYQASVWSGALGSVSTTATTQFRLYLGGDDNGNFANDTLLLDGGESVASKKPSLTVWYYLP
jgi:hypothetical protein